MWAAIVSGIGSVLTACGAFFQMASGFFQWVKNKIFIGIFAAVGTVAVVYGYVVGKINGGLAQMSALVKAVPDRENVNSGLVSLMDCVEKINAVVPVDIILSAVLTYVSFRVAWAAYKFVKSWIPTLSGSG